MSNVYYIYTYEITRTTGTKMETKLTAKNDTVARLKAKNLAKSLKGTFILLEKNIAPYSLSPSDNPQLKELHRIAYE